MSQVLYARVPDPLKTALDDYAEQQGVSLSSAVADLLQRGLAAAGEERSIASLEAKLAKASAEKTTLDAKLQIASGELTGLRSFANRAQATTVGSCPSCGGPITGLDLLGRGTCTSCERSLLDLVAPKTGPNLDDRAFGAVVGALGVVLIAAILGGAS